MVEHLYSDGDLVSELIGLCHRDHETAERLYQQLIVEKRRTLALTDKQVKLSEQQLNEFVERFSAEVGVSLWESKRRKT